MLTPGSGEPPDKDRPQELTWQLIYCEDAGAFQGCTQLPGGPNKPEPDGSALAKHLGIVSAGPETAILGLGVFF